jgi:hypothetical protein
MSNISKKQLRLINEKIKKYKPFIFDEEVHLFLMQNTYKKSFFLFKLNLIFQKIWKLPWKQIHEISQKKKYPLGKRYELIDFLLGFNRSILRLSKK